MANVDSYVSAESGVSMSQAAPLRKILVAVGRQGKDDGGLRYAAKIAAETGATVRVLHIRQNELYRGMRFSPETPDEATNLVTGAVEQLRDAGITASGAVRVALLGREGVNIVDEAANWQADAIVLGPGPVRSWRRLFARGVRGQVLRLSAIPVIVPPAPTAESAAGEVVETRRGRERHAA